MKHHGIARPLSALIAAASLALCLAVSPADAQSTAKADTAKTAVKAPKPKKAKKPALSHEEDVKRNGPWAKGTNWLNVRAGMAKQTADQPGDGFIGYGMGYQRMLSNRWAVAFAVHHDVVGQFGVNTVKSTVPMMADLQYHVAAKGPLRPFLGVGAGYFWNKAYRTANDYTGAPSSGIVFSTGVNLPIDDRNLLGLDLRVAVVDGREGVTNASFGNEGVSQSFWSAKINWALHY